MVEKRDPRKHGAHCVYDILHTSQHGKVRDPPIQAPLFHCHQRPDRDVGRKRHADQQGPSIRDESRCEEENAAEESWSLCQQIANDIHIFRRDKVDETQRAQDDISSIGASRLGNAIGVRMDPRTDPAIDCTRAIRPGQLHPHQYPDHGAIRYKQVVSHTLRDKERENTAYTSHTGP